jgi:curli biogenesis system outer membrane secretion channel CsgG
MTTDRLLPLAALAAAVLIAGCGSSTTKTTTAPTANSAKAAYTPVQAQIKGLGTDIGAAITAAPKSTDAALAATFTGLATRARIEVTALDGLAVPAQLTAARNALRDAVEKGTGDLQDIATASRAHDATAARTAAEKLVADSEVIRTARAAFEQSLNAAK